MSDSSATTTGPIDNVAAIVLAAGKSTRMRSKLPKPLHPLCGLPLTGHVVRACQGAGVQRIVLVIGHEAAAVRAQLGEDLDTPTRRRPWNRPCRSSARSNFQDWLGSILVLAGDVPLLPVSQLSADCLDHHHATGAAATMLTARLDDPSGYGRVLRDDDGAIIGIVEHRDATPEQRKITEWNPSIYVSDRTSSGRRYQNSAG